MSDSATCFCESPILFRVYYRPLNYYTRFSRVWKEKVINVQYNSKLKMIKKKEKIFAPNASKNIHNPLNMRH